MTSMKQGLLVAAATAALIAGAGGAFAQAEKKMDAQGGAQVQGGADTQKKGVQGGAGAQGKTQTQTQGGKDAMPGKSPSQAQDSKPGAKTSGQAESKSDAQPRGQVQQPGKQPMQDGKKGDRAQDSKQDSKQDSTAKSESKASSKSVQINQEQRTRISQTIKQKNVNLRHVDRTEINFQINVGVAVPRTVTLYPLPAPIVAVVPAYRGYLYIVVGDDLLIIHPQTYEIVAIIQA